MERKLDVQTLFGGILLTFTPQLARITHTADPWRFFQEAGFYNVLRLFAIHEVTQFSESKHNLLRESTVNYPGIGPATARTVVEAQITISNVTGNPTTNNTRERDRQIIVFTPIIWLASFFYAFNPNARLRYTEAAIATGYTPAIFVEQFKRVRHVTTPIYRILSAIAINTARVLLTAFPELQGSFWDYSVLETDVGIRQFIGFCEYLRQAEGNYIPFVAAMPQTLPPLESGSFLTFGAYTVPSDNDYTLVPTRVIAHSLTTVHGPHVGDSVMGHCRYVDSHTNEEYDAHVPTSSIIEYRSSYTQNVAYIVARVTQKQLNDKKTSNKQSDPSLSDNSKSFPETSGSHLQSSKGKADNAKPKRSFTRSRTVRPVTDELSQFIQFFNELYTLYNSRKHKNHSAKMVYSPTG